MAAPDSPAPRHHARRRLVGSVALLATVAGTGALLAAWKSAAAREANAAAAQQPEPAEVVAAAVAGEREHRPTTTAIGTVLALRSISLRNELAGTVRYEQLTPGRIVGPGTVLVALDVSVEEAELRAQEAQAQLAQTTLDRMQRMAERRAASAIEVDNARAERDVALAQIARTKAIIARKTIRAPFRARVGIADVHIGQFLEAGTPLTTLQGVDEAENVDFSVAQAVAAGLHAGQAVRIVAADSAPLGATIVAVDARVDPATRTAMVRARIADPRQAIAPGASVRVEVPVGASERAVVVPASALRKGPAGDHVFVLTQEKDGKTRAHVRQVTSGPVLGDEIVIVDGLQAGERVAASGSFKLREAALVALAPSTPNGNHTAAR
ncbi:efflux transporter, RND family, MFP subunit [Gemmatirosa kalamazoonensis]|uniref:Efflux transporter, RND family, MFP subunit n=1 Tax=Gemmatirosa kalamazoonensis TaxID=861299 RepID=W0RFR5_9BACT|nr:efflux transporter, RND family, MFP subunit [Gemmatirosa kalamazoonensis]